MYKDLQITKVDNESFKDASHPVILETPLLILVNGRHAFTAMISPFMMEEFVTGFLYTEKIIKGTDDIESIKLDDNKAGVLTKNPFKALKSHKTILSGCGGASSFLDAKHLPRIDSGLTVSVETIKNATETTLQSELHKTTGGIHIIGLFDEYGNVIKICEDIGRHNALDKIIGFGLINKTDFSKTFVVSSGRISTEMVYKCLVTNIPIIVSRGATTTAAVEAAETGDLTIVGFVRGSKMNIYSGFRRIQSSIEKGS